MEPQPSAPQGATLAARLRPLLDAVPEGKGALLGAGALYGVLTGGSPGAGIVKTDGATAVGDSRSVNYSLLMRLSEHMFPDR